MILSAYVVMDGDRWSSMALVRNSFGKTTPLAFDLPTSTDSPPEKAELDAIYMALDSINLLASPQDDLVIECSSDEIKAMVEETQSITDKLQTLMINSYEVRLLPPEQQVIAQEGMRKHLN